MKISKVAQIPHPFIQAQFTDIIGVNRYQAWYSDVGEIEIVETAVKDEVYKWMQTYNKPVIYTEYGADTVAGLHTVLIMTFKHVYRS